MTLTAREIAERLAQRVQSVCETYLSNGHKHGRYWLVGDVFNTPGQSLYVRLTGPSFGPGAAGKWTDAATSEHGDLLNIIQFSRGFKSLHETRCEALRFLSEPIPAYTSAHNPVPSNSAPAARRLFASAKSVPGTFAETYLRARAITCPLDLSALRFHPRCYYSAGKDAPRLEGPALLAAVTDLSGTITAVQRTYLAPDGRTKANLDNPRRALGELLTHAVRFGTPDDVLAVGEGVETMLAVRSLMPSLPVNAAISANHLAALVLPPGLKRLYIALDNDPAGRTAAQALSDRYANTDLAIQLLMPTIDDWNSDLLRQPIAQTFDSLSRQLLPIDQPLLATPKLPAPTVSHTLQRLHPL